MWILFSLLCMAALTAADLIGKKAVESDESAPIKLRISVMAVSFVLAIGMYLLGLGESGLAPWTLLLKNPAVFAGACCGVFSEFLYIFSLRYVGMTVMEAISSFEGVVIFSGLIIINLISGSLSAVRDMLIPARLVLICPIIVFTVLLPNIETTAGRKKGISAELANEKHRTVIGVLIALLAVILGCGDSLIADTLLDSQKIGVSDLTMTIYFSSVFPLPFFCLALYKKSRQAKMPVRLVNPYSVLYSVFFIAQIFLGLLAVSVDAVRSEILYLAYPVLSILGARIVLKEKYTKRQNICIWVITVSAILFCIVDGMV